MTRSPHRVRRGIITAAALVVVAVAAAACSSSPSSSPTTRAIAAVPLRTVPGQTAARRPSLARVSRRTWQRNSTEITADSERKTRLAGNSWNFLRSMYSQILARSRRVFAHHKRESSPSGIMHDGWCGKLI